MNPLTGRFVSRDPENGDLTNPKTLHRYMYANGDPINLADPTGKTAATATWGGGGDIAEYALLVSAIALTAKPAVQAVGKAVDCAMEWTAAYLRCAELLSQPNPPRGLTGGYKSIAECARGFVSEECGGNPVSW
jgi:hypothetical protein